MAIKEPITMTRYARHYSDGSFNVASHQEDAETAIKHISGSTDDDDTQLVQVEIRIIKNLGTPKLKVVADTDVKCPCCGEIVSGGAILDDDQK